jgi:hypothetical protein
VPIVRRKESPDKADGANAAMFDAIAAHLARGGNILIFPEGTSHSEPQLAPLRSGAARMLAAAEARMRAGEGRVGVAPTFQAVALEFDARDDFRSRALVLWGPVRALADVRSDGDDVRGTGEDPRGDGADGHGTGDDPRGDGEDPRGAGEGRVRAIDTGEDRVRAITAQMDADLRELLVEGASHDERLLVARIAEMLANDAGDASLSGWSTIGRHVEQAGRVLRDAAPALAQHVQRHVTAYYDELARFGLSDAQLAAPRAAATKPRSRWLRRAAIAPLAVPGIALYAIPYVVPRLVARRADPDAVSTIKLGVALVVYPLWAAGLVALAFALVPPPLSLAAAAVAIASPFAALAWLDAYWGRTPEHAATPADLARIARLRIAARTAIDEARARLPA